MGKFKAVSALFIALLFTGCCIDENGQIAFGDACEIKPINATFKCGSASCSGMSAYNASGINIWNYKNSGSIGVDFSVSMRNVNKNIMVVFTNEGSGSVAMPSIHVNTALKNEIRSHDEYEDEVLKFKEPEFMMDEPIELIERSGDEAPSYKVWNEGNKYNWYSPDDSAIRATTLRKQLKVDGRTINIWVENSEYANGMFGAVEVGDISSSMATIYTSVVGVAGEPWGAHKYINLIASDQPLDIVFIRLDGAGGYFHGRNNYIKLANSKSNEAVAIFVDTRMGTSYTKSTIAHELTHAINFYQRYVLMGSGNGYSTFLNEMTAVMMEDVISGKISYNSASSRYRSWLSMPLYHRDFADWKYLDNTNYATAASFGSFLLRQYGINFYKTLLRTSGSSTDALDRAIKTYDDGGLAKVLRNWGASIAMFPAAGTPKGFGYPARSNDNGFNLVAFDGDVHKSYRRLPASSPSTLAPRAHFPFLRQPTQSYTYEEQFRVPSGVSVSIVVK
ncbi:MAG: hypothetical protein LBH45_04690 [Campylobacteraceae bacterium]|jgi:hypothetical protein|nr:hypothetical protein [Campylobacteraceae bacterium]